MDEIASSNADYGGVAVLSSQRQGVERRRMDRGTPLRSKSRLDVSACAILCKDDSVQLAANLHVPVTLELEDDCLFMAAEVVNQRMRPCRSW